MDVSSLCRILFEEAENPESKLNEFLEKLSFKFVLENLSGDDKLFFLNNPNLDFAQRKIPDFDLKLTSFLEENLKRIGKEVLKNA